MTNKEFLLAVASEKDLYEHAKKLVNLIDQVDCLLSMAKRIRGKAVDDGDAWEISDDVFQEVQKALEDLEQE